MTVREIAMLARHIILTYPEFYKLFGEKEFTWNKIRQQNRNPLLNSLEGADGLKTGYTEAAGPCLVATAERHGVRLGVVLLHSEDPGTQAARLLTLGFHRVYGLPRVATPAIPAGL